MTEEEKGFILKNSEEPSKESPTKEGKENEQKSREDEVKDSPLPEINFATFIFSLNSSAFVHLGVVEDPTTGKKNKSINLAKQTIDILVMLEKKTKGNLTSDEEKLLNNILHDLRLMYVKEK